MGKYTYLKKQSEVCGKAVPKSFFSFFLLFALITFSSGIFAQNRTVQGTVSDANTGEALIGVSVVVKGSTVGTVTDIDGKFTLPAAANSTLVISYVGYIKQEVNVENQTSFLIKLEEDSKMLDEVVVIGYGTMRKKDLTGSIVQVRPDRLANENPKTVQDILRGTPGLSVGYSADAKGGGSMQIRGQRSVSTGGGHNDPLIILDGMMFYGELSEINPDDIGQIDVLKDASAASVYGARAASGVIIITTKKGQMGKPVVNVSANFGVTTKSDYRKVFSPDGYMQYREDWYKTGTYGVNSETGKYEAYQTGTTKGKYGYYDNPNNLSQYGVSPDTWRGYTTNATGESDASIYGRRLNLSDIVLQNYIDGNSFDWYDHTFRTGINQDYNASVSGASERMNYYMSLGYLKNEGAVVGNEYQSVRANLKLTGTVTKWLEISANVNFQDRSDGDIQPGLGHNYWDANQVRLSPYASYRDSDGNLVYRPMGASQNYGWNYDYNRQYMELEKGYQVLNSIFTAKVKLPFNITYSFNGSPRYQYFFDRYFESSQHPDWVSTGGLVNREQAKRFDWSINNTINWDYTFAQKHKVNVTLVQEAEEQRYWKDRIEARNILPSDALGFHNTKDGDKTKSSYSSEDTHYTADALLARLFYSYDDKYMLTTSVRRDGYSAFGQNNPHATFPSVALAWSFVNEDFFKWKPMSSGKLRVSWGKNGNRSLENPYVSIANLVTDKKQGYLDASGNLVNMNYLRIDRMANPGLQWEKTEAWNFGWDYGFLNDRITGNLEYYTITTHDMIMTQRLPGFTGFSGIGTNLGEVQNRGVEFAINSLNMKTDNFEWRTTFGFSYNKNEIKHLYYQYEDVLDASGKVVGTKEMDDKTNGWFIGQAIGTIWDYKVTGIWQADEVEEAARYGQKPGDPKVENSYTADDKVNADGSTSPVYNDNDKQFLGKTSPPIHWSIRNDFTLWKNLSLSFSIYSYMGHKSLETYYLNQDNAGSLITNGLNTYAKEYWTIDNPTNKYGRLNAQGPTGAVTAGRLHDRSFIRLENISVGYTLPKAWLQRFDVQNVKIFGSVRNVAVWKKDWEYGDPETGANNNGGLASRIYSLGLNLTF
ncbi:SusC/RagA family TonB-linked outer membrane protein [Dysgonomonas sp. GY75]|uniref:SusC/RagA family TonB-linked outer membrane protein n=1 Tax=Dysgonomonas sp. GY75 TaxID=2780419 RepID=UPI001883A3FE|nr:SusC/RagA family TonB-linked outer membrane protein [Dysgonomonas sp. GY75]MBF0650179.1 SusC/RagA family TonB-linked outer membrane protein [Dysgonomonas sp. GY75]